MCGGDFAGAGCGGRGVTGGSAALSVDLFTDYHCYGLIIVVVIIIITSAPNFDRATLPQGTGPWVRAGCLQKWQHGRQYALEVLSGAYVYVFARACMRMCSRRLTRAGGAGAITDPIRLRLRW